MLFLVISVILLSCIFSIFFAWLISRKFSIHNLSPAVSYAVGAMLGTVFLELLPEIMKIAFPMKFVILLLGIFIFFLLEKMVLWRHCHSDNCQLHVTAVSNEGSLHQHRNRNGIMVFIGGWLHNFVDGILIAGAFKIKPSLGLIMSFAIIAHKIPQEIGDFLVFFCSWSNRRKAFQASLFLSLATPLGLVLGCLSIFSQDNWAHIALILSASSLIYIAIADLIPGLHRVNSPQESIIQTLLILLGIASIIFIQQLSEIFMGIGVS